MTKTIRKLAIKFGVWFHGKVFSACMHRAELILHDNGSKEKIDCCVSIAALALSNQANLKSKLSKL